MDKELLRTIIADSRRLALSQRLVRRRVSFEDNGNYVLVGVRQAGKSCLLYQRMQDMVAAGCAPEGLVYVNFDDERLAGMGPADLDSIVQAHSAMSDKRPVFFFDEIQNVPQWEHFARRLANERYRVYITGSNARMLSRDIATTLGGRYWTLDVYPYSFAEYLDAHAIGLPDGWQHASAGPLMKAAADYLAYGGFPELTVVADKRGWLSGIYRKIFFGDIVVRNAIRNEAAIRLAVRRLAENVKQPTSFTRLCNIVKSAGAKITVPAIIDYVRYMQDGCLLFSVGNLASRFAEREGTRKHYFVDNGLLSIFLTDQPTALLENICAIELHKRYGDELFYYGKEVEVDFVAPDDGLALQACYNPADEATLRREVRALEELNKLHPCRRNVIVAFDQQQTITAPSGLKIDVVPLWRWLLEAGGGAGD